MPKSRCRGHHLLALSASVSALMLSSTAFAQEAAEDEAAAESTEIVVVAQGRAQALSEVPVAVSAVSADVMQNSGANDIRQLNQVALQSL